MTTYIVFIITKLYIAIFANTTELHFNFCILFLLGLRVLLFPLMQVTDVKISQN